MSIRSRIRGAWNALKVRVLGHPKEAEKVIPRTVAQEIKKPVVAPPPKVLPRPKPLKSYEVVLMRDKYPRGPKHGGKPTRTERYEVRVQVHAHDTDEAKHEALKAIGNRVDDGYMEFFERIGLYRYEPRISEMARDADDTVRFFRHSGGSSKGAKTW